jgi:hypothetical protein
MGIKIRNNLPFELKRIENLRFLKIKNYLCKTVFILYKSLLITTIDSSLVILVSFDMIRKYINGLWTVIFTKCVMACFICLTYVFGGLSIFIVLY